MDIRQDGSPARSGGALDEPIRIISTGSPAVSGGTVPAHDTALAAEQLDPGIADVVIMLRNLGFHPTDSGDGVSKPDEQRDFDVKHVACSVDNRDLLFTECERLQKVLGSGWSVEASYTPYGTAMPGRPAGSIGCILLATKNEPPGPRHAAALAGWPFESSPWTSENQEIQRRYDLLIERGRALYDALKHELGRR